MDKVAEQVNNHLYICKNGDQRSPDMAGFDPGSDYLGGGRTAIFTELQQFPDRESKVAYLAQKFAGAHLYFIIDTDNGPEDKNSLEYTRDIVGLYSLLTEAKVEYEEILSQAHMNKLIREMQKRN